LNARPPRRCAPHIALTVACALSLLALTLASTAAGAATPSVVPNCLGKPTVKPAEIILACADAGLGVRSLHWLAWGQARTAGLGTAFANDCTPNCAAGHFHSYDAVIVLSGSQRCDGVTAYRTAQVAIVGSPPAAWTTVANATYPLRCVS
jgi:hypothetical protein